MSIQNHSHTSDVFPFTEGGVLLPVPGESVRQGQSVDFTAYKNIEEIKKPCSR